MRFICGINSAIKAGGAFGKRPEKGPCEESFGSLAELVAHCYEKHNTRPRALHCARPSNPYRVGQARPEDTRNIP